MASIGLAFGWLAPRLPPRSSDIEIEAAGGAISAVLLGCSALAAAGIAMLAGRRSLLWLLPGAGLLFFSLGFFFAMGGAGYDDRTGAASPVELVYLFSTAGGALLAASSMAALSRPLARVELGPRASRIIAIPLVIAATLLAMIWGRAIASILETGTSTHTYYRAGSFTFFWATVLHDAVVIVAIYLLAAGLLIARRRLSAFAGFFASSYLAAHFVPAIAIEIERLRARGEVDAPLLVVSCVLTLAAAASAAHIARAARTGAC